MGRDFPSLRSVMSGTAKIIGMVLCVVAWLCAGCDRWAVNPRNEAQEANFIEGNNFRIQGQTNRAIQSFEQALHVNPSNALAHLAVADLYFSTGDFTSAAYHYSRCNRLQIERNGKPDPTIQNSIDGCELQLAVKYSDKLGRQQTDSRMDELRQKLAEREDALEKLSKEVARLRLAANGSSPSPATSDFTSAPAYQASPVAPVTSAPTSTGGVTQQAPQSREQPRATRTAPQPPPDRSTPSPSGATRNVPRSRTYTVRAGDTPTAIARRAGVSTKAFMAANPGLNPSRLRPGQVLNFPNP